MEIIRGIIYQVGPEQRISDKFTKKEIVVQEDLVTKYGNYTSHYLIQAANKKIEVLNGFREGQQVEVKVNISGRKFNRKDGSEGFMVSLDLWEIKKVGEFNNSGRPIMQSDPVEYNVGAGGTIGLPPGQSGLNPKPNSLSGIGQHPQQTVMEPEDQDLQTETTDLPF
jgi:hypothetical protein